MNTVAQVPLESGEFERHLIVTDWQLGKPIRSVGFGDDHKLSLDESWARCSHGNPWHRQAGFVTDLPVNVRVAERLRMGRQYAHQDRYCEPSGDRSHISLRTFHLSPNPRGIT